jgi:lipid-binding SYLF domain-containing protein
METDMHERLPHFPALVAGAALLITGGCATVPGSDIDREHLRERAGAALQAFRDADPSLENSFFESAAGWAVFPSVGKGGAGYGGAFGRGVVYAGGEPVGYCSLTQASIGFQLGGQVYKELIFFEDQAALAEFRAGDLAFSAQVSAVAATADAARAANYRRGVAVFLLDSKGLMYEASVGGQKFEYVPFDAVD